MKKGKTPPADVRLGKDHPRSCRLSKFHRFSEKGISYN
jgi:hypothetical protein